MIDFLKVKNLDKGTENETAAVVPVEKEQSALAGFADFFTNEVSGDKSIEQMEPVKEEVKKEESKKEEPKKEEEIKKTDEGATKTLRQFEVPVSEEKPPINADPLLPIQWDTTAKELGIVVPEGTTVKDFNEFKSIYQKNIDSLKQIAESNKQVINKEEVLKQFNPETRPLIEYIENGGNLQDYLHPEKIAAEYLAMSSEDLMKEEFKELGIPEENIDARVTALVENGLLDLEADKVRAGIKSATVAQQNEILQRISSVKDQRIAEEQASESNKLNAIKDSLAKTTEFLGGEITQKERDYVFNEYKSGRTKQMLNDPEVLSEFLLFKAFGSQALGEVRKTEYSKGVDSIKDNLFNTPPKLGSGGPADRRSTNIPAKEGDFSAWNEIKQAG